MKKPNIRTKKIVLALRRHASTMGGWVKFTDKHRRFRSSAANTFLLAVLLDRSIKAEKVQDAAEWMNKSLGEKNDPTVLWKNLLKLEKKRLLGFLRYGYRGKAFHRFYKTFARQLQKVARHILLGDYHGDLRRLWRGQRNIQDVREKMEKIPGIGLALSRIAILTLVRKYGLLGGKTALPQLDIKPDIHVMRVFKRTGLISKEAKERDAIKTARILYRKFPAVLDAPAWKIGREWCRPHNPSCRECPIRKECPKIINAA